MHVKINPGQDFDSIEKTLRGYSIVTDISPVIGGYGDGILAKVSSDKSQLSSLIEDIKKSGADVACWYCFPTA